MLIVNIIFTDCMFSKIQKILYMSYRINLGHGAYVSGENGFTFMEFFLLLSRPNCI